MRGGSFRWKGQPGAMSTAPLEGGKRGVVQGMGHIREAGAR